MQNNFLVWTLKCTEHNYFCPRKYQKIISKVGNLVLEKHFTSKCSQCDCINDPTNAIIPHLHLHRPKFALVKTALCGDQVYISQLDLTYKTYYVFKLSYSSCPWLTFREFQKFLEMFAEDHNLDFNEVKKKLAICGPPMTNNTTVRNIFFPISFFAHQNLFLKWWNTIKSLPNI